MKVYHARGAARRDTTNLQVRIRILSPVFNEFVFPIPGYRGKEIA
jgi:hypothetical protein